MKGFNLLFLFLAISIYSQTQNDNLFISTKLQPISEENIFKTNGWYNWGTSIIKGDDGLYHMFYARWEKRYKFTGWLTHSEIAHAISETPTGPWKYLKTYDILWKSRFQHRIPKFSISGFQKKPKSRFQDMT